MARRPGLRVRLAALVAVGATAVLTIAALALYDDVTSEVSDAITTELDVRLADLVADLDDPAGAAAAQRPVVAQAVDATGAVVVPAGAAPLLTDAELAGALQGDLLVDRPVPGIGDDARVLARRLDEGHGGAVVGVTATTTAPLQRVRNRLVVVLLVAGPALTAAVALTGWVLAGAALRPVRRMAQRAETISMTAPGERLPEPPGDDEIAELGRTLNAMLARIEATIAHERGFIDDASHELRTPLAVLRGEIELAAQDDDLPAIRHGLHSALEETDRLTRLSDNLLTLARADAGQLRAGPTRVDLLDAVRAAVARIPCPEGVTLTVEGEPATVRGEPEWIERVVANLVINAVRHARSQVRVTLDVTTDGVRLSVADDGPGFPDELLPRAFDRFSRGDSARRPGGIGLGLAIVASIMRALGGTARAGNGPPLGGARVEATFPDQGT
jgi:two-component system OmpR family sensor kinase